MAFPYVFEANFELGTNADFDSEADSDAVLSFPRYDTLASINRNRGAGGYTPYTGAYCVMIRLNGGTNPATVEAGDMNIAANTTNYIHFNILFGLDFQGTADDTCGILKLETAGDTAEAVFGFRVVGSTGAINLGIGETAATTFSTTALTRGIWYTVELIVDVDNAGANDGTIDLFVTQDGAAAATTVEVTQVGSLDQAAIEQGTFGIEDHLATTTGTILLDNLIQDDARVYPIPRFGRSRRMTKSGHAFVGPGTVEEIILHADGTNAAILEVFDTDSADTNIQAPVARVEVDATLVQDGLGIPFMVKDGAYITISGTGAWAEVFLSSSITTLIANSERAVLKLGKGGR